MFKKRCKKGRGRLNKIPLNMLRKSKGLRRTRPRVSKELITVHKAFRDYQNLKEVPEEKDLPEQNDDATLCEEINYNDDSLPAGDSYNQRKRKAAEKWEEVRASIQKIILNRHSANEGTICFHCKHNPGIVRCHQCSPYMYCMDCSNLFHDNINFHHCPEIWKDGCFVPVGPKPILIRHGHTCKTGTVRMVTLFSLEGIPRKVSVQFCKCKLDAHRLMELGYWPATPSRPVVAFSMSLMDWMEATLLECQIAVQDFTSALKMLITEKFDLVPCNIYPVIIDSFEEYRHYKENVRIMKEPCSIGGILACPACPKDKGILTLSVDANFGLCRKRTAGSSVREPLSGISIFCDQKEVNDYVLRSGCSSVVADAEKDCSDFLAGSALRSCSRFSALDETAIMGVVCRHEYPLCFINLYHGERLSYSIFLLEKLLEMFPNHQIQLMYDVACVLIKHLQAQNRNDILERFDFAVPVFHAYGHSAKCQVLRSPRNIAGYGLSDGEVVERLWAYLRRFASMTKEMRPSHRIDVLSDAIKHYARCASCNIGNLLCKRMRHAKQYFEVAKGDLEILKQSSPETFTLEDIEVWNIEAKGNLATQPSIYEIAPTWQEQYICHLDTAEKIRNAIQSVNCTTSSDGMLLLVSSIEKIESQLSAIEASHQIANRWTKDSTNYQATSNIMQSRVKQNLRNKMTSEARERWFLLRMKSKYADGQKIAVRLSRRINVVTKSLRKSLAEYNTGLNSLSSLTWEQVTDLSQQIHDGCLFSETSIPSTIKSQATRLYNNMLRAEEEITRLKEEMSNCMQHFISIYDYLTRAIVSLNQNLEEVSNIGRICLLKQSLRKYRIVLTSLLQLNKYINITPLESFLLSLDDNLEIPNNSLVESEEAVDTLHPQSLIDEISDCEEGDEEKNEGRDNEDNFDMLDLMSDDDSVTDHEECSSRSALPLFPMVVDMSQSDSEDDEEQELEVQYWRKERHYRETYLDSIEKNTDMLDSLLTDRDREMLKRIKKPRP